MASSPAFKSGSKSGRMQGGRAGTETHRMSGARPGRKSFFKLGDLGAGGQPVRAQGIDHCLNIGFINRLVPVRQESFSYRRSAVDGQQLHGLPELQSSLFRFQARARFAGTTRSFSAGRDLALDQSPQLFRGEPVGVGVAAIAESVRQRSAVFPVLPAPPGVRRLDHVHIVQFHRVPGFVFGDQHLVQLFSGTDADAFHLATRSNGFRHVRQPHAGNLGNEDFAAMHLLDAAHHEAHAMLQREPEAGHAGIGNGDLAPLALLHETPESRCPGCPPRCRSARN